MKKSSCILLISCILVLSGCTKRDSRSFAYLGQKTPGLQPELFAPGIVSTAFHDVRITFSPDLKECYFYTVYKLGEKDFRWTTLSLAYDQGHWSFPEIAFFSGLYNDHAPCIHPDGSVFIYQTDRPLPESEPQYKWNFWIMKRQGEKWSDPVPMGPPINGRGNVFGPSLARNGNLYFTRELEDGSQVIFYSRFQDDGYQEPHPLPSSVNSTRSQFDAAVAPDESYLIVPSYGREDTLGSTDYYISFRDSTGGWSQLINLGKEFNTDKVESGPYISPDGRFIFFQSYGLRTEFPEKGTPVRYEDMLKTLNSSDIYWVDAGIVEKFRPESDSEKTQP